MWRLLIGEDLTHFSQAARSGQCREPPNPEVVEQVWLARGITIRDDGLRVTFLDQSSRARVAPSLPEERIRRTRFRGQQFRALLARFDNIFVEDSASPATAVLVPARFRAAERVESVPRAPAFPAGARPDANRSADREASESQ